jgi:CRP-like cAMP-binding protein
MVPLEIISECKVFKMFPDNLLQEIAAIGEERAYKANDLLFNRDEPANNMFVLMKGKVDILTTKRTQMIPLHTVYPYEAFGLSAMIRGLYVAAARATEDSVLCCLPVVKMEKILEEDYKAAFLFMKQIALLVSNRLVKIQYQLEVTGSGYI